MDKLDGIKDKYMYWEYDFNLTKEDINWLIEKVEQQQEELEDVKASNRLKQGHIDYIPTLRENYEKQIRELENEIVVLKSLNNSI